MNLEALSFECRQNVLDMIMEGRAGHIGGDFSVMDILITLYFKQMNISPDNLDDPDRDLFVMSKGHSVEAYYAVLAAKGFLDIEDVIKNFSKFGSPYIGHPNNKLPGIEMNSGSLGHGLPVCVGMALANKMDGKTGRVYTVMGDGELAEGSVWEGAMAAGHYKLDNLCAIVDRNRLQISGNTEDVMADDDLGTNAAHVSAALGTLFTVRSAVSFLVFTLLYTPCVAAIAAIKQEMHSTLKTIGIVIMQCGVAWLTAWLVYIGSGVIL